MHSPRTQTFEGVCASHMRSQKRKNKRITTETQPLIEEPITLLVERTKASPFLSSMFITKPFSPCVFFNQLKPLLALISLKETAVSPAAALSSLKDR